MAFDFATGTEFADVVRELRDAKIVPPCLDDDRGRAAPALAITRSVTG
ncbi:hypothetical protein ACFZBU_43490 [Embleya sp. NPDC008237]